MVRKFILVLNVQEKYQFEVRNGFLSVRFLILVRKIIPHVFLMVFSVWGHDLHVREILGPFRERGGYWVGLDNENRFVDLHLK